MRHVKYPRSSVLEQSGFPKTPAPASLDYGELAINYVNGLETISVKNSNNNIVKFRPNTNVFVKNFLTPITSNDVCAVLSVANVYNYQNFEISFLEAYDGNLDLSDIIGYIKNTFYNVSDINLVMNVVKANDSEGAHTSFYINSETMQDLMDDASKPMSNKSSVIGFTKYGEYFIASDSTSMSGIEINWDHTTKAVTVRYSYMDNVYRMNGDEIDEGGATSGYFYVEDASGTRSANVLTIKKNDASAPSITVYKSTDQTNWTLMGTTDTTGITAEIPANGRLYLRAKTNGWSDTESHNTPRCNSITCSNSFNIGGNIMSLLAGGRFEDVVSLSDYDIYTFEGLFEGAINLIEANLLILPNTTENYCYSQMFHGCTSLTAPPILPATTLSSCCYYNMFNGCESLIATPELPARTLASSCYSGMFSYCTSLTTAPVLPATRLEWYCYSAMFLGCTSLTTAPALPATTLAGGCYSSMFFNCSALTIPPTLPVTTLQQYCYSQMFEGCTSLTTAPVLPATTLASTCYFGMFSRCSSLTSVTTYAEDISAANCLDGWLDGVAATGNFYNMGTATYPSGGSGIPTGWTEHKERNNYFWVENITNQSKTVTVKKANTDTSQSGDSAPDVTVYYSTDQTNWTLMGTTSSAITHSIAPNSKLYLKATSTGWGHLDSSGPYSVNVIRCDGNFNVGGNIMSLLAGDNFASVNSLSSYNNNTLQGLLFGNSKLINAERLVLPSDTKNYCYNHLFESCTNLTSAPLLPATTVNDWAYNAMFAYCHSLVKPPVLPATSIRATSYGSMFYECTSLLVAPHINATTVGINSCEYMFHRCSALTTPPPILPATTLASGCYGNMFRDCTSLTTAPVLPATTLGYGCYQLMFFNCSSLATAPVLSAETLTETCYHCMFTGCSSLTTAPALPATTLANNCYSEMFYSCTSLTTAPILQATTLVKSCYSSMFAGCTSINSIITYANDISAEYCLNNWLYNVAATGDFYNLGSADYPSGTSGIPSGWTEHTSL